MLKVPVLTDSLSKHQYKKHPKFEGSFVEKSVFETMAPSAFEAADADRTHVFQGGDFGGGGMWYLYGMQK